VESQIIWQERRRFHAASVYGDKLDHSMFSPVSVIAIQFTNE
jgi:hypothetical protein